MELHPIKRDVYLYFDAFKFKDFVEDIKNKLMNIMFFYKYQVNLVQF